MIKLNNISKKYDDFFLENINLEINEHEYFVILGPSGAGKTVLLEIIAGFEKQDSGDISDIDLKNIGFIYQDSALFPHLNIYKNIEYGLRMRKIKKDIIRRKIDSISKKLKIDHLLYRDVNNLSGGEKQRVAIARALVIEPALFLLDEPTGSLDPNLKKEIQVIINSIHKETNATFIHVTHDFEEAVALADRIAIMNEGKIIQIGTPEEIFKKPATKFVADFVGFENLFSGEIKDNYFSINGFKIYSEIKNCQFAHAAIRANDIIISKEHFESSAKNSYLGEIIDIKDRLNFIEITVYLGVELKSAITHNSFKNMDLKINDKVWATFKSSSVRFFCH